GVETPEHLALIVYGVDYHGIYSCLIPTLSHISVSYRPESRLRHWCSSISLRISPLHMEFHSPLLHSSLPVSNDPPRLSRGLSYQNFKTVYSRFKHNYLLSRFTSYYLYS